MLLTFSAPLAKDATATLRMAGFRYSRVMQHWEGLARFDEAEALAAQHGGSAQRVNATASGEPLVTDSVSPSARAPARAAE